MLYIKLAIISKRKQFLPKKLCEHIRQLIIKAIMRLSVSSIAHISWSRLPTQEFHSPEKICPSIPTKGSLNRQNIHKNFEMEDSKKNSTEFWQPLDTTHYHHYTWLYYIQQLNMLQGGNWAAIMGKLLAATAGKVHNPKHNLNRMWWFMLFDHLTHTYTFKLDRISEPFISDLANLNINLCGEKS